MSLGSLPSSDSSNRSKVLVADDDPAVRRLIVRALIAAGFEVSEAPDGRTAAHLVVQTAFAAVVTDITMPGVRGTDLLRLVREHDLDLPVILITGEPNLESAIEALRLGATDYFTKPVELSELQRKLQRVVQLRQLARARREAHDLLRPGRPEAGDLAGLEVTFDRALRSLWLAYQPIVDVASRALFGYDALPRSREPTLPHPGAVLEADERLGRLDDIGRAVREMAPAPMVHAPAPALLFVNLCARPGRRHALRFGLASWFDRTTGRARDHGACVSRRGE
jgi:CheY-like chemotaxis protein